MSKQRGFTLLETQIAVGVLALSLSMIISIYLAIAKSAKQIYYRHVAVQVLEEMIQVIPGYLDQLAWLAGQNNVDDSDVSDACLTGSVCDHQQMLLSWWQSWRSRITEQLPAGQLTILCEGQCMSGHQLRLRVIWQPPQQNLIHTSSISDSCLGSSCIELSWPIS